MYSTNWIPDVVAQLLQQNSTSWSSKLGLWVNGLEWQQANLMIAKFKTVDIILLKLWIINYPVPEISSLCLLSSKPISTKFTLQTMQYRNYIEKQIPVWDILQNKFIDRNWIRQPIYKNIRPYHHTKHQRLSSSVMNQH